MVLGQPRTFHKKFKFIIEIDEISVAGFQKCSALEAEVAIIQQSEGGVVIPNKSPGRVSFSDLTLERGAADDREMYDWWKQVVDAAANIGLDEPDFKRNLDIVQQARSGAELLRWRVLGAWPTKFVAGEWDNEADENVIQMTTITYDTFDLV